MRGFADGGFTSSPSSSVSTATQQTNSLSQGIKEALQDQRVYVLESDITSTQKSVQTIDRDITF